MKRISWALGAAAVLVLTAFAPAASAATTHAKPHKAASVAPSPVSLVTLGSSFSPSSLTVKPGQIIVVTPDKGVVARVFSPAPYSAVAGGELGRGHVDLFVAIQPGTSIIDAVVRPWCPPFRFCPQWIAMPKLTVTVKR
jgi:hypothetical protein